MEIVVWGGGYIDNRRTPEDLKRFNKHKKQKGIIVGSIIAIILIIGGISLYRSFAMYEEKQTFDVLKGTVPDFRPKCDPNLHGAEPVLGEGMIPVKIGDKGVVTKVDSNGDWYNYCEKNWANAVILADGKEDKYEVGATINETDIESYFVWIPKYSYKLFDKQLGRYETTTQIESKNDLAIEIKFGTENTKGGVTGECATPMLENNVQGKSGGDGECKYGDYMTHPAFLAFPKSKGLWIGKFETGYEGATGATTFVKNYQCVTSVNVTNANKVIIKPNSYSWRCINAGNTYKTSLAYKQELQSHLMKNTEWGAVAYLTQSIYGRCNKDQKTCTEVTMNDNDSYVTGTTKEDAMYFDGASTGASTTGNYSGIYDMSGGTEETVAGVILKDDGETKSYGESGLGDKDLIDPSYYDVYLDGAVGKGWNRRILGDATGEVGPFGMSLVLAVGSMWGDDAYFTSSTYPWLYRGGHEGYGPPAGTFAFGSNRGVPGVSFGYRIVLTPQQKFA